jgi:hypothetical protein
MRQRQLNWADLNGVLAVLVGPLGGVLTSAGRGAAWPLVVLFAILGCGVGVLSAMLLGRLAYACLNRQRSDIWSLLGYMLLALAMPAMTLIVSVFVPAIILAHRGAA